MIRLEPMSVFFAKPTSFAKLRDTHQKLLATRTQPMGQKRQLMRVWAPELSLSVPNTPPKNLALFRFSSFNGRGGTPLAQREFHVSQRELAGIRFFDSVQRINMRWRRVQLELTYRPGRVRLRRIWRKDSAAGRSSTSFLW